MYGFGIEHGGAGMVGWQAKMILLLMLIESRIAREDYSTVGKQTQESALDYFTVACESMATTQKLEKKKRQPTQPQHPH